MKKNVKKNARKNYYKMNIIKLEKETAWKQFVDMLTKIDENTDAEYTLDFSCFTKEERAEFEAKLIHYLAVRAQIRGRTSEMEVTPLPVRAS
jgi:Trp operon repressor